MDYAAGEPKWRLPEDMAGGVLAGLTRGAVIARVNERFNESGERWSAAVNDRWADLFSLADGEEIAARVFEEFQRTEGRKFYAGSEVAIVDKPELYILRSDGDVYVEPNAFPDGCIGDGDNVFQADDVTGKIIVVRRVTDVDRLITEGVPSGTIGVIDDAGGTMTAPILPDFEAVICLAGTVRSHLGILAREFGVPTLMAARLARPLETGETVTVSYSVEAQNVNAYLVEERKPRALICPVEGDDA